jgi:hypothetical protein
MAGNDMGFHELIEKVQQAETALEAKERQTAADWRQAKATWNAMWTPGRIMVAGLASGFLVGQARPLKGMSTGQGLLQLATAVTGLLASGSAHAAAQGAEDAADATTGALPIHDEAAVTAAAIDTQRLYREAGLP